MRVVPALCVLVLATGVLASCESASESGLMPRALDESRAPPFPPDDPSPGAAERSSDRAPGSTTIRPVRRQSALGAPVIRGPAAGDEAARFQLREPIRTDPDGGVTMSFDRISIPDFSRAVFGELLGLNYSVTPGLQGAVSLQIIEPVRRDQVFAIATAALETAGVAVRRDGDFVLVEPDPRDPEGGPRPAAMVVRRLEHVDGAELERALLPFTSGDAQVIQGPAPGTVILAGSSEGVGALDGLVTALDIDPLSDRYFGLFPLQRAASGRVTAEIRRILAADGFQGTDVVDIARLNAVLVIADGRRAITEAGFWVSELDLGDVTGEQVFIYPVQNRRAPELAELLQDAFGVEGADAQDQPGAAVAPGLTPASTGEDAAAAAPPPVAPFAGRVATSVKIFADEGTNSVVTIATPDDYAMIEAALRQMDVQPVQVLIEATIIEVRLNDRLEYGVRWFFESGDIGVGFTDLASGLVAPSFPGFNFVLDTPDVRAVISALDQVSDVQVVSAPSLMVLNNETARLEVGDEIPVITQQAQGADALAPVINSVTQRQTGIVLDITPRVNASGLVLLDVVQEVSEVVDTDTSEVGFPTIANRQIQSSVALRDRETLALGGLITSSRGRGKAGIPILSNIPVVGALFGSTEVSADRTELLVVIRPVVVRNHSDARLAYRELRAKLQGLEDLSGYLPR